MRATDEAGERVRALGLAALLAGLALGESPGWFAAVGVPGNLLAIVGMVWLGVAVLRRRTLPIRAGVLAILAGLLAVGLSEYGTSALAGAFWLYAGARLVRLGPGT